jgi:hypothetical protein
LQTSSWHLVKRTNLSGETTLTMTTFTIAAAGECKLLNPATSQFKPGDQLRILPAIGAQSVLLILALVLASVAMLGGFIVGLIAALGSGRGWLPTLWQKG